MYKFSLYKVYILNSVYKIKYNNGDLNDHIFYIWVSSVLIYLTCQVVSLDTNILFCKLFWISFTSFHIGELTMVEQSSWWIWATWSKVESRPLRKECSCRRQSHSARNNETKYGPVFGRLDRSSYSCWFFLSLFPPNLLCSAFGLCIWLCPSTHLHAASKNQTKTTRKYFCIRNFLVC